MVVLLGHLPFTFAGYFNVAQGHRIFFSNGISDCQRKTPYYHEILFKEVGVKGHLFIPKGTFQRLVLPRGESAVAN